MTKLCPRGKAAAKRKFKVYPSEYANAYASRICAGKIKDPSGVKRKDFRGPKKAMGGRIMKAGGGLMEATARLKRQGLKKGSKDVIIPPKKPKKEIIRDPILKPVVKVLKNLKETIYEGKNMKSNVTKGPIFNRVKRMGGGISQRGLGRAFMKGGRV